MVFESLYKSAELGELMVIDGGLCQWHLRRDDQLTIQVIIATKKGAGSKMLQRLKEKPAKFIFAKCPADLEANGWYEKKGFRLIDTSQTKTGRLVNHWRMELQPTLWQYGQLSTS